jgi:hypothetical protein
MDESPTHYATIQDIDKSIWQWHAAEGIPLAITEKDQYFFTNGSSYSKSSINDGQLTLDAPLINDSFNSIRSI